MGFNFMLRNEHIGVILTRNYDEEVMGNNTLTEGLATRYALRMVCQYEMTTDSVENNSRTLIDRINDRERPEVYHVLVIEDIKQLTVDADVISFFF